VSVSAIHPRAERAFDRDVRVNHLFQRVYARIGAACAQDRDRLRGDFAERGFHAVLNGVNTGFLGLPPAKRAAVIFNAQGESYRVHNGYRLFNESRGSGDLGSGRAVLFYFQRHCHNLLSLLLGSVLPGFRVGGFHHNNQDLSWSLMKIETIAIHGGYSPEPTTKAVATPIYQTTSYAFDDTQHAADLFDLKAVGNIYTRMMNPTTAMLEQRVAEMEGGVGGLAFASGMAAITAAIQTIAEMGDNIIATSTLYGGTYNLFAHTLPKFGVQVRFADYRDPASFDALIDARTKAIFCESIGNPLGNVVDFGALAEVAHRHGVPLIVDNTVPTPYLCRPLEHGADIIIHALTKYMGGHGTSLGGLIVDGGKFPWAAHKARFPTLNTPDVSYHGVVFTEAMGAAAYIARARVIPLRNMGAAISPFNSFLIMQGIETLPLRMDRHCENTLAVAQYLRAHSKVSWVEYAALADHPGKPLVDKYMGGKASGILTFGIQGGRDAGARFIDALRLITHLVNIGDAKSLACHPATTTHRQLSPAEMAKAGVSVDMVRLSIGIEHIDDILADIAQALQKA